MNREHVVKNERGQESSSVLRLAQMGMLAAVSVVLILYVRIPLIPAAPFLVYDMADVPVLLGAYLLGPLAGLMILTVASAIQAFMLGGDGIIGFVMHMTASTTFVLVASAIYHGSAKRTLGLILGLVAGTISMTVVMVPMNFIFIPTLFFEVPLKQSAAMLVENFFGLQTGVAFGEMAAIAFNAVKDLLLPGIIPFNLAKAGINSVLFFLLFKGLRLALKEKML